ncbi:hypothetical protein [Klebsiella quasivariicola]|uniref:hypothetical protein n=1 Tax=Klebsiella quasivariicola TaxID=2026240 RepID=UPI00247A2271|nr:hypothetical protein [Klebsiella quasivariicola]
MLTKQSLSDALQVVGYYRNELHQSMLIAPTDKLIEIRAAIDAFKKLEFRLTNEIKSSDSTLLNDLNK